jgi:hypothetical protein
MLADRANANGVTAVLVDAEDRLGVRAGVLSRLYFVPTLLNKVYIARDGPTAAVKVTYRREQKVAEERSEYVLEHCGEACPLDRYEVG